MPFAAQSAVDFTLRDQPPAALPLLFGWRGDEPDAVCDPMIPITARILRGAGAAGQSRGRTVVLTAAYLAGSRWSMPARPPRGSHRLELVAVNVAVNLSPEKVRRHVAAQRIPLTMLYDDECRYPEVRGADHLVRGDRGPERPHSVDEHRR